MAGGAREGKEKDGGYWAEEEVSGGGPREGTAQLDKEVILTMLGDLEQVLHTQPRPRKSVTSTNMKGKRRKKNLSEMGFFLIQTIVKAVSHMHSRAYLARGKCQFCA